MEDNNDDMIIELMAKSHRLYRKYIKIDSTLEINISYELRNKYIIKMDKLNEWITCWEIKNGDKQPLTDRQKIVSVIQLGSQNTPH